MATADQLDSRLTIDVIGVQLAHAPMLIDCVSRAASYLGNASEVTITCNEPDKNDWHEYAMLVKYSTGGQIFIGAIRRTANSVTEFHS